MTRAKLVPCAAMMSMVAMKICSLHLHHHHHHNRHHYHHSYRHHAYLTGSAAAAATAASIMSYHIRSECHPSVSKSSRTFSTRNTIVITIHLRSHHPATCVFIATRRSITAHSSHMSHHHYVIPNSRLTLTFSFLIVLLLLHLRSSSSPTPASMCLSAAESMAGSVVYWSSLGFLKDSGFRPTSPCAV